MTVYEAGEAITLYADLMPGRISPVPEGVPEGAKTRIVVTSRMITVGWQFGREINRIDIPVSEEDVRDITFKGGQIGEYSVSRGGGCACGSAKLQSWQPWPNNPYASSPNRPQRIYGVPPTTRYARL